MSAQAFEAGDLLNIFLRFLGFWGSFSDKKFSYKIKSVVSLAVNIGKLQSLLSEDNFLVECIMISAAIACYML